MAHEEGVTPTASVEALKQLKNVEVEWAAHLEQAREATQARLARARDAAESTIAQARSEVDRHREGVLQEARAAAQVEADRIVNLGQKDAAKLAGEATKGLQSVRAKLLAAVLGEFRADSTGK
jgi:vacuolar-type H+-ATPase subunit H